MGKAKKGQRYYLHEGRQGKHLQEHNNWEPDKNRSPITTSKQRLKELFDKYHGTGETDGNKEVVDFEEVIGKNVDEITGREEYTTWGKIHYGKDGAYHIVPYKQQN